MMTRRSTVEHPFGTIKAWMGHTHFLTRRLVNVRTEMALKVLAYSMKRMISLVGIKGADGSYPELNAAPWRQMRSLDETFCRPRLEPQVTVRKGSSPTASTESGRTQVQHCGARSPLLFADQPPGNRVGVRIDLHGAVGLRLAHQFADLPERWPPGERPERRHLVAREADERRLAGGARAPGRRRSRASIREDAPRGPPSYRRRGRRWRCA
jgi:Transposase DDE domain